LEFKCIFFKQSYSSRLHFAERLQTQFPYGKRPVQDLFENYCFPRNNHPHCIDEMIGGALIFYHERNAQLFYGTMKTFLSLILPLLIGSLLRAAPSNDAFSAPTPLSGLPVSTAASNVSATLESGEPVPSSSATGSVWFTWTASTTGQVRVDTNGSTFDTILAVWTGNTLATLSLLGHNDDSGGGVSSLLTFQATAGTKYRVAVYGFGSDSGSITLNLIPAGTINGTVTGPNGSLPLQNILVSAYQWTGSGSWSSFASAYTSSTGTYSIGGLAQGNYRLGFYDPQGNYVTEYYNNSSTVDAANDIAVATSATVSGIHASLAAAGRITGTVTGPDGSSPLANIAVSVYYWYDNGDGSGYWRSMASTSTNSNGSYSLGGLPAGTYRVGFDDYNGNYLSEYYNNVSSVGSASDITVATAATVSGIHASLATAGRITGTVTGPNGSSPLEGIQVRAYQWYDEGDGSGYWDYTVTSYTGSDGSYSLSGLNAGNYRLRFYDSNANYLTEFYNNASTVDAANDIVVATSATVSGIHASLAAAGRITGTVTGPDGSSPLEDIDVSVYYWYNNGDGSGYWRSLASTSTNSNGSYSLGGLAAGTYRVGFDDYNGNYLTEYYNNVSSVGSAHDITVAAAATVSGIDASLATAGRITGTVTGPDGSSPLEDIQVRAYQWYDDGDGSGYWDYTVTSYTSTDGSYSLSGLDAGSYRLRFFDSNGNYFTEFYNNASTVDAANDITVAASATVSGIHASLAAAGRITGTVTGPDGSSPLEDIDVSVYYWYNNGDGSGYWRYLASTSTNSSGSYSLGGLAGGTYRVGFDDYNGNYLSEYYNNVSSVGSANDITVVAAATVSGIHASLATAGRITGTVTGPDGSSPLEDIQVRAYQWYDDGDGSGYWDYTVTSYTGTDGSYSLSGLDAGSYRLRFYDSNGTYLTEFYNNASTVESASDIAIATSATVGGINASLQAIGALDTPPGTADPSLTPATATSNAKFSATVIGTPGASVVVEASPDLGTNSPWAVVHRFNLDSSGESALSNVEVPDSQGAERWFFRLGYE
jgi:hypothetical protein